MKIGKKIFYDKLNGNVIVEVGEMSGLVQEMTIEQAIANYKVLSQRVRSTFDVLELAYGQYSQDFASAKSYRVNPATKKLEFSYETPSEPTAPPVVQPPLSDAVKALADENANLMMQNAMQDVQIASLEDENAEFMMRIAMIEMGGLPNV